MVFKLIITDNSNQVSSFTLSHISTDDILNDIEEIIEGELSEQASESSHFAALFHVEFQNTDFTEEAVIDNLTNPEYMREVKTWNLSGLSDIEENLLEFVNRHDTFQEIGI